VLQEWIVLADQSVPFVGPDVGDAGKNFDLDGVRLVWTRNQRVPTPSLPSWQRGEGVEDLIHMEDVLRSAAPVFRRLPAIPLARLQRLPAIPPALVHVSRR